MIANEFTYFLEHRAELLAKYLDKYIVVKDGQVLASFDTEAEGYTYVVNNGLLGKALLQVCSTDEASYIQYVRYEQRNSLVIDLDMPRIVENDFLREKNENARKTLANLTSSRLGDAVIVVDDNMPSYSQGDRIQAKLKQTEANLKQMGQDGRDELLALRKPPGH